MTTLLALGPALLPLIGALIEILIRGRRMTWTGFVAALGMLGCAVLLANQVLTSGPVTALGLVRIDAASAFMLVTIGAIGVLATAATPAHLRAEQQARRIDAGDARLQGTLVQLFLAAMALAVSASNLGVLWVAIEATTIVTAFLVGQRRTRAGVEAAWKYVVICTTGIAVALLGIMVLNFAAQQARPGTGLDLAGLTTVAAELDPGVARIAVVLLILGFGTKAGLAPMHAWLPDAHSQAPAPVSALMSGVLLSVAFYAVLRIRVISDAALGPEFARVLLGTMALASLLIAASLLLAQRDYKRMLAYSSIEHMGLVAIGAAIGGTAAVAALLLHIIGHGLVKSVLFIGAGRMLQVTGTSRIAQVRGLLATQPMLAGCFGAALLALVAMPPFVLFASELGIIRAGFAAGLGWLMAAVLLLLVIIGGALVNHTSRMLLGAPAPPHGPDDRTPAGPGHERAPAGELARTGPGPAGAEPILAAERPSVTAVADPAVEPQTRRNRLPVTQGAVLVVGLVVCAVLGIWAGPLHPLLDAAAVALSGGAP